MLIHSTIQNEGPSMHCCINWVIGFRQGKRNTRKTRCWVKKRKEGDVTDRIQELLIEDSIRKFSTWMLENLISFYAEFRIWSPPKKNCWDYTNTGWRVAFFNSPVFSHRRMLSLVIMLVLQRRFPYKQRFIVKNNIVKSVLKFERHLAPSCVFFTQRRENDEMLDEFDSNAPKKMQNSFRHFLWSRWKWYNGWMMFLIKNKNHPTSSNIIFTFIFLFS